MGPGGSHWLQQEARVIIIYPDHIMGCRAGTCTPVYYLKLLTNFKKTAQSALCMSKTTLVINQ